MEHERKLFTDVLESVRNCAENRNFLYHVLNDPPRNPKSAEASEKARKIGNAAFLQQKTHDAQTHKTIFDYYCQSVALAPVGSETLAVAYGNRSYFLLHIHKYDDCIKDIDRALRITTSNLFKAKLLCRKAECLKNLGSSNVSSTLAIAQRYIEKIGGEDGTKLLEMVEAVKALIVDKSEKLEMNSQRERIDALSLTDDYLSRVSIQHNEKYGRLLVAARDYKAGEIIFVEKVYACAFMEGSSLSACDYCSESTWSSIPCDYCDWSMYCSKTCKEKAWNEFHDMECSVISHMREHSKIVWKSNVIVVRILVIAIKETGSIVNLRKELESVDHCKDATSKGFFKNDQLVLNSIRNVYALTSDVSNEVYKVLAKHTVPLLLISLIKCSVLKNNFNVKQAEDLFANEDIIFLGSLTIKIVAVLSSNGFALDSDEKYKKYEPSEIVHFDGRRCLSALFSLFNHSCSPKASWCCTKPNQLIAFALHPIKKNSQIFISYQSNFYSEVQSKRQAWLLEKYNFKCDCQACINEWPLLQDPNIHEDDVFKDIMNGKFDLKEYGEIDTLLAEGRFKDIKKMHIDKLSPLIRLGMRWRQPSFMFWLIINSLGKVFTAIYSAKSLLFSKCK